MAKSRADKDDAFARFYCERIELNGMRSALTAIETGLRPKSDGEVLIDEEGVVRLDRDMARASLTRDPPLQCAAHFNQPSS